MNRSTLFATLGAVGATLVTTVTLIMLQSQAGETPPADLGDDAAQYARAAIPQSPITVAVTSGGAPQLVARGSTTICFKHGAQLRIGCSAETHFTFTETNAALTSMAVGASFGTESSISDPEGDSTAGNRVGPATGAVPHGDVIFSPGWTYIVVPPAFSEDQAGYRGGVCYGDRLAPCDDDGDCARGGCTDDFALTQDRRSDRVAECMFMQLEAASAATCHVTAYR